MDAAERAQHLAAFKRFVVAHPLLLDTVAKMQAFVMEPAGAAISLLYGPTGVGKSTVVRGLSAEVNKALAAELADDPGRFGVIKVDAPAPTGGSFSWKQFFISILEALGEPIADPRLERSGRNVGQRLRSGEEARRQVEHALAQRRPKAVLIDEAPHIANLVSGTRLLNQLDLLKSLADRAGTHFVLIGTFDLLAFRNLSGQLGRRTRDVHFRRYLATDEQDMRDFRAVVRSFGKAVPIEGLDLVDHSDLLYERSLGCVGMLKDWLTRSLSAALALERPFLSAEILEANALPLQALATAAEEIHVGEAQLADNEHHRLRLRELLGLSEAVVASRPTLASAATQVPPRPRVGTRNPARDPIGVQG
jgi:hypothetical protein